MGTTTFIDSSITLKKGQSLDLVDTVAAQHVIKNGKWVNGAQQETKESGAPDIGTVNFAGNDTKTIGPFNSAGTFAIYCTIHPNMDLTVTVTS
jgi:plastocyanin